MNKFLFIGTTSLNRSLLHSSIIPDWNKLIMQLSLEWKIIWVINIDVIDKLDETYLQTKQNFINIIDKRIELHFLSENMNPSFFFACKNISCYIKNYVDNNSLNKNNCTIMWLEDDWKLELYIDINYLLSFVHNMHYMNLTFIRNNYIWALAPSLISYDIWELLFYNGWTNHNNDDIDPEHCIGLYYKKIFGNPDDLINITMINKSINNDFFLQKYINHQNSYYTYINQKYNIFENDKYIKLDNLKNNLFDNKCVMLRLTPKICNDIGRTFMDNMANLKKNTDNGIVTYVKNDVINSLKI